MERQRAAAGRQDISRGVTVAIAIGAVVLLGVGLFVGYTRNSGSDGDADADVARQWAGQVLASSRDKPDIVLTDTNGDVFDLRADTEGKLTLLFFGYTNCPDVCPATLINISAALKTMAPEVRSNTELVFVTVDPERDTPEVIDRYLGSYDPRFIGLTGSPEELTAAQDMADIPAATFDQPDDSGYYTVGHYSDMVAYSPDGQAHLLYPFGTRQSDWARDLPRLAAGEHP